MPHPSNMSRDILLSSAFLIAAATPVCVQAADSYGNDKPAVPAAAAACKPADNKTTAPAPPPHLIPPMVFGCNDEWKIQIGGEERARFESRRNFDHRKWIADNDNLGQIRTRLNVDATYQSLFR